MVPHDRSGRQRYREAGVDIDAGNALVERLKPLARATARRGADATLGGFGALVDLRATGFKDPLLVATTDGAGTKLLLAIEAGRLERIGIDLVAMCVNDLVAQGATPLAFLDYFATGRLEVEAATRVLAGVAEGCRIAGCALVGGETAEMPGLYAAGHFDLAGFALGAVERGAVLPRPDIVPGDRLLGVASSGIHSNGFSLVRLVLEEQGVDLKAPAPFAPDLPLHAALLEPTRIYVASALRAIATGGVKAIAHITGGGLLENLPRVLPDSVRAEVDSAAWRPPPVFGWLMTAGNVTAGEMARTFNMGLGLVVVAAADRVAAVRQALEGAGEQVHEVGEIAPASGRPSVAISGLEKAWQGGA